MTFRHGFHDDQPEADAGGAVTPFFHDAAEALEEPRQRVGGHPLALVADADDPVGALGGQAHRHPAVGGAVLDGIGEQVDHGPAQQREIAAYDGLFPLRIAGVHLDADAARVGLGPHLVGGGIDQTGQVQLDEVLRVGALGAYQAEQTIGQVEGRAGVAGDARDLFQLHGRIALVALDQGQDGGQWRAQIVGQKVHGVFATALGFVHGGDVGEADDPSGATARLGEQVGHRHQQVAFLVG